MTVLQSISPQKPIFLAPGCNVNSLTGIGTNNRPGHKHKAWEKESVDPITWHCPFCNHRSTIKDENTTDDAHTFADGNKYGTQWVYWKAISCPNPECLEYTFTVQINDLLVGASGRRQRQRHSWQLVPASQMKILPDYVPAAIVADYKEACLIAELSPKASATLSRRCLQGMIRDFWGVSKGRLVDEIDAIKDKIDELAWNAIDGLRKMGNIGAHMEKDINVIVDGRSQ